MTKIVEVKKTAKRRVNFSISEKLLDKLLKLSKETGYNKSVLVSLALEKFMRKEIGRIGQ